jgi:CelD/BcsL family acetyltransferase involved in cellulose biosynthesis
VLLRLSHVPEQRSLAARLAERLDRLGWRVARRAIEVCPFIPLAGRSWDSYLASRGAEHRYAFRRKLRRLQRLCRVELKQAGSEEECRIGLATLVRLHLLRWSGRGGSDAFDDPALVRSHQAFGGLALARGWLRLYVLELDGVPAAAIHGIRYGSTFFFYQSGLDPRFASYSVGLVCMGLVIQRAIEEGATEYDLLHGAEPYKLHWAEQARTLVRFEMYPPRLRGLLMQQAFGLGRAAQRLALRILACGA